MADDKKFEDLLAKYSSKEELKEFETLVEKGENVPKGETPIPPPPIPSKDINTQQPDLGKETAERIESIGKGEGNNHENEDMLAAYRDKKPAPAKKQEQTKEKTQDDNER